MITELDQAGGIRLARTGNWRAHSQVNLPAGTNMPERQAGNERDGVLSGGFALKPTIAGELQRG